MELLERIKLLCKEKGISQSRMEREIGLSNGASSKWKSSSPSMEVLKKLADYFDISVEFLISGNDSTSNPTLNSDSFYLDRETKDIALFLQQHPEHKVLFEASRKLKPEDIHFIQELIERMSGK